MHRRNVLLRALALPCFGGLLTLAGDLARAADEADPKPSLPGPPARPHPLVDLAKAQKADLVVRVESTGIVAEGPRHLSDQVRVLDVFQLSHNVKSGEKVLVSRAPTDPGPRMGEVTAYLTRTPGGGWTWLEAGAGGLSHPALQSPALKSGDLEWRTVAAHVWTRQADGGTENVCLGVRVSNVGEKGLKVGGHTFHLWLSEGNQPAKRIEPSRNGLGKPVFLELAPGASHLFLVEGARLAWIGSPRYLAFTGRGLLAGDWLERALAAAPEEVGVSFEYEGKRTEEVRAAVRAPDAK